jgi:sucrose-6-phosphate hydrolase SacC (GH32 family)
MTAPRELRLACDGEDVTLVQRPAAELKGLRRDGWSEPALLVEETAPLDAASAVCEIVATLDVAASRARCAGIRLMAGSELVASFRYEPGTRTLNFERHGIDVAGFDSAQAAPLADREGLLRLHLLIDRQSVELFANDGRLSLTNQIFPGAGPLRVELFADGGVARFVDVAVYRLDG